MTILYLKRYLNYNLVDFDHHSYTNTILRFKQSEIKTAVDQFEGKLIFETSENNRS